MSHAWFLVRWLHLLAMAFFVGGQMMLAAVVVPVARRSADREGLRAIARRFGQGTLLALGVLFVDRHGAGVSSALVEQPHLSRQARSRPHRLCAARMAHTPPELHALEATVFLLSLAIVWIGLYLANGYS